MTDRKEPRPAATVLLVRAATEGVEVFMVKRPGRGDFPDLHVFPGGKVDAADDRIAHACVGLDDAEASAALGVDGGGLQYWVSAIRECFEEAGVLLAYRDSGIFAYLGDAHRSRFDEYREALIDGSLPMVEFLDREQLTLATDRVLYFSHWITPVGAPARFDVRFFITAMPPDQDARGHDWEVVSGEWVRPEAALEHHRAGRWQMIYPTLTTLASISGHADVDGLLTSVGAGEHLGEITEERHIQGMQYR